MYITPSTTIGVVSWDSVISVRKIPSARMRDRAVRSVRQLSQASHAEASHALEQSGWNVKKAAGRLAKR